MTRACGVSGAIALAFTILVSTALGGTYEVTTCSSATGAAQHAFVASANGGMAAYSSCPHTPSNPASGVVTRASAAAGSASVPYFAGAYQVFRLRRARPSRAFHSTWRRSGWPTTGRPASSRTTTTSTSVAIPMAAMPATQAARSERGASSAQSPLTCGLIPSSASRPVCQPCRLRHFVGERRSECARSSQPRTSACGSTTRRRRVSSRHGDRCSAAAGSGTRRRATRSNTTTSA